MAIVGLGTDLARTERFRRFLVDGKSALLERLFTARVHRARATYNFDKRAFVRLIGQYVETERDPALYTFAVPEKVAAFDFSGLLAYKLNWQTVAFLGYGDRNAYLDTSDQLEKAGRELFMKVSYAWQQ